jgi:hypothetical protein
MTVHQRRRLMMMVLGATLIVSAIAASNASAVLKKLPNGQVVSYQPLNGPSSGITPLAPIPKLGSFRADR